MRKQEKGITLIALVVTIVVLLILAGVSIAMLGGENGIITKALEAKKENEKASIDEQRQLAMLNASMNNKKQIYTDKNGNIAIIPAGFATTDVEGEKDIDDGLVIIDKKGNEYVWIPVTKNEDGTFTNPYVEKEGKIKSKIGEVEIQLGKYEFDSYSGAEKIYSGNNTENDISEFKESVKKYGGYYVGRYESGIIDGILEEKNNVSNSNSWTGYKEENMKIVSQIGEQVLNYVTQEKAVELCEKIKENNEYVEVESCLINGYAWDTSILFIQKVGKENNSSKYSLEIGKTLEGDNILKTGEAILKKTNKKDIQCNIYDLATNCLEWTTEISSNSSSVFRGGVYNGSYSYVSGRYSTEASVANDTISFRPILYLK